MESRSAKLKLSALRKQAAGFYQEIPNTVFERFLLTEDEPTEQYKAFSIDFSIMEKLMLYFNGKISRTRLLVSVKNFLQG